MNYFAHGLKFLDTPYVLAGTAVPDWLSVVDRRVRARARRVAPWVDDPDPVISGVARGVIAHHHDDARFHQTRPFAELSLKLTVDMRRFLPDETGFRHSFLGHILVEILLDGVLIEQDMGRLDAYYHALGTLNPHRVSEAVHRVTTGRAEELPRMIQLFCRERFLYDYLDDAKLLMRLNRVMRRVNLPELPPSMLPFLAAARQPIRERAAELLDCEPTSEFKEKRQ
ncbi:hypothetical protein [Thioalkalivibrio sp.]|uniref:hypothetical protein n=1 Tax=Thioalkalivibrio sp. TaxID=2093813 RepID=UPI003974DCA8